MCSPKRCFLTQVPLNVFKLLTGDLLKILCDMGHGDEVVIADANFPTALLARRLVRLPALDGVSVLKAILSVFPLDTYCVLATLMELTAGDQAMGLPTPSIWAKYQTDLDAFCGNSLLIANRQSGTVSLLRLCPKSVRHCPDRGGTPVR